MCGRPDDTHAGACSCTMWVERKTVRQTASRQHMESAWASAAQHSPYGLCGTDITASAGVGLGVTCPSAIAT